MKILIAITITFLLSGCYDPDLHERARASVREKHPNSTIEKIENYAALTKGPSRWLVKQDGKFYVVFCNDRGQISYTQNLTLFNQ